MIDARELRIGNWVKGSSNDVYHRPFQVSKRDFSLPDFFNNVDPIPLTPEILEKLKFSKINSNYFRLDTVCGFYLLYEDGEVQIYDNYDGNGVGLPIKYLHDYQNAIFALTGEEPNIKL